MNEKMKIVKLYKDLCESTNKKTTLYAENSFFSYLIIRVLFITAIITSAGSYFLLDVELLSAITNGIILVAFSFSFLLFSKVIKNEQLKLYIFAVILSAVLIFTVARFFILVGPVVLTASFILGLLLLTYTRISMIIIFSITNVITNLYLWFNLIEFNKWENYYITQTIAFIMLFVIFILIFKISKTRQQTIIKHTNNIAIANEKMLATLLSVGDGIITIGIDNTVELINPVAEQLTGWSQYEATGKSSEEIFNIVNEYTKEKVDSPIKQVFNTGKIVQLANHTLLISRDGRESAIEDTAAPIIDNNGNTIGCVLVFRDFSEKKERQRKVEYLSYHDQLTGLYNRRYFEEESTRLDTKRNLPLSVIFGDVNGLKIINDAFGHSQGDQLIQMVAEILKAVCRADDIIARVGGDEFIILLPKTDSIALEKLIVRIREQTNRIIIKNIETSVSFGWDTKNDETRAVSDLLKKAEDFMYQKKILSNGSKRNGIVISILNTLLIKSPREEAHSMRVSGLCEAIGRAYHLNVDEVHEMRILGQLHDIGKISIDESILNNENVLSNSELTQIKQHPEIGYRLLGATNEFYALANAVLAHHERWDGKGYPNGVKGEAINWKARALAIADAYDAMVSERPYKASLSKEEAIAEIKKNAGAQFDPDIARVFVEKVLGCVW